MGVPDGHHADAAGAYPDGAAGSPARRDAALTIYSYDPARGQETGFCDFVFAVPPEQAGEWHVRGGFTITGQKTEGNWSVTFPLEY